jgi:Ca2+-transporting ATPase
VLLGWPVVLFPVHVLFMELVIDPACSVAFEAEPEERDVTRRPPRRPDAPLLDAALLVPAFIPGTTWRWGSAPAWRAWSGSRP